MLGLSILNVLLLTGIVLANESGYVIPTPKLELLSPKGFTMSIPHQEGMVLFAFHGTLNRAENKGSPGDFYGDVTSPTKGRWVYKNTNVALEPGDVLRYWIHVQKGNQVYRLIDQSVVVPANGAVVNSDDNESQPPTRPMPDGSNEDCILSKTTVKGRYVCQGQLIFEDNFDVLNWTIWKKEIRIPCDSTDADFVSFQNRPQNCYIRDGHLHIVPTLLTEVGYTEENIRRGELNFGSECTGIFDIAHECRRQADLFRILPPIVSARIRTKESFSFRYGKVEARARLTKGDWLFPQILLEPSSNEYGISGYASGQMRVAFIRGNELLESKNGEQIGGSRLSGGVVLTTGESYRDVWLKNSFRPDHLGRTFHTYSLTWDEDTISLAIDGNNYATIRGGFSTLSTTHNISYAKLWESGNFIAPFDKEFYIALGVSAGGISDFPDDCKTAANFHPKPWENSDPKAELRFWNDRQNWHNTWDGENAGMTIDYVKVWAL